MANSDKNILITPNKSLSGQPEVSFTGAGNSSITIKIPDSTTATLNFESSGTNLLSIDSNLSSGSLFNVTDQNLLSIFNTNTEGDVTISPQNTTSIGGNGLILPSYTTTSLPPGEEGLIVYDSTVKCVKLYSNSKWINLTEPEKVLNGLVLSLDAGDSRSYPGTGSIWYDLSGYNNNFAINPLAYNRNGPKFMDFNGGYGCAKKTDSDFAISGELTIVCWTRVLNSAGNWRTLVRGNSSGSDHQVIIQSGGWDIGMYDNTNGTGFNGTGFSQQSLPGYGTQRWNMLVWRWNNALTPYYSFSYNDTPDVIRGSNNSSNTRFKHGFCSIGAYNDGNQSNVNLASQYWGDIATFDLYNRYLTNSEIVRIYNITRGRFGV
jgi:hypothetical protein